MWFSLFPQKQEQEAELESEDTDAKSKRSASISKNDPEAQLENLAMWFQLNSLSLYTYIDVVNLFNFSKESVLFLA